MTPQPIEYSTDDKGNIILPEGAPFDGSDVLIKIGEGWVEARWEDGQDFCWVCLDDSYEQQDLDSATLWCSIPVEN